MLSDRICNALAAWLNGDIEHAWMGEHLGIESATVDGDAVVVVFEPTDGGVPFRARFQLTQVEPQSFAHVRERSKDYWAPLDTHESCMPYEETQQ